MNNLIIFFIIMSLGSMVHALTPEQKALLITEKMSKTRQEIKDSTLTMNMRMVDRKGRETQRVFTVKTLRESRDHSKALLVFDRPKDIKGTALLTHTYLEKPNEQWLYLPASKRLRKISSGKKGSFLGSEFSFEDMGGFNLDEYTSTWRAHKTYNGEPCEEIVSTSQNSINYSQIVTCISPIYQLPLYVQFYNKAGQHFKTLINSQFNHFNNKYWLANSIVMTNHLTGKETHLKIVKAQFNSALKKSEFNSGRLKRRH
jgi:hypothetical protein